MYERVDPCVVPAEAAQDFAAVLAGQGRGPTYFSGCVGEVDEASDHVDAAVDRVAAALDRPSEA